MMSSRSPAVNTCWTSSLLLLLLLSAAAVPVNGSFPANQSSYLNFLIPRSLHTNQTGGIHHRVAHFGAHYYSGNWKDVFMAHPIYYPENYSDFCLFPDEFPSNHSHHPHVPHPHGEWDHGPFFLLVDRGECSYVTKVRNAQRHGAAGVIIADDSKDADHHLPVVKDDGSGHDISIPAMMVSYNDAKKIKDALLPPDDKEHHHFERSVVAEMAWHWPQHEHAVFVSLWHSPVDLKRSEFLSNFSKIALKIHEEDEAKGDKDTGGRMHFHAHYSILNGLSMQCKGNAEKEGEPCFDLCTNNGRYCAVGHHSVSGKEVVVESLRRMCVEKHYPGKPWWEYVQHFTHNCLEPKDDEYFANPDCLKDAFSHAGIDQKTIEECMKDSGDVNTDSDNNMLQNEVVAIEEYGILETPYVLVDERPLPRFASLDAKSVMEMFCFSFAPGKAPHVCHACALCGDPVACVSRDPMQCLESDNKHEIPDDSSDSGDNPDKKKKKKKSHHFWRWFFIFSFIAGAGGYVFYKRRMGEGGDGLGSYTLTDAFMSDSA